MGGSLGLVLGCFGLAQVVLVVGSNIYNWQKNIQNIQIIIEYC